MDTQNVLLITIDSLRTSLIIDGNISQQIAPRISGLINESVCFTQSISNGPNTPASFPSILTSTQPLMYGSYWYLDNKRPFLAQTFKECDFTTVGYHSNPHLGAKQNYDAGFDTFNDSAEGFDFVASIKDSIERRLDSGSRIYILLRRIWHYFTLTMDSSAYAKAPTITENALEWFEDDWDEEDPFFMWLHYMDVHYPFQPPERFLKELEIDSMPKRRVADLNGKMQENPDELTDEDIEDLLKLYKGEIRFTDHYIGKVLDELEERNILNETIVVITADHGEAFGEHGRFGHHPYLYDELLRVPLIMHVPGFESRTIDQQVSLIDLGPTIYDLLGINIPDAVQGTSFAPLLRGEEMDEEVAIATGKGGETLACRTSKWKAFWLVEEGRVELYDLQEDPNELNDVSAEYPEVVGRFKKRMQDYLDEAEATDIDLPEVKTDAEVERRLRDLGYLD